jgi:16S rRNA (cytosine967-C5)-methyltransferase
MTDISGRVLALKALLLVEEEEAYTNLALLRVFNEVPEAERRERAFATELVYGVLRNRMKIDYFLGRLLSRPFVSLKPTVRNLLRLALYQLLALPDIPERAVCHSAVELLKRTPFAGLAGLVNAVLRRFIRERGQLELPDRATDLATYLEIVYSHPRWLVERWLDRFGPETTEAILQTNNQAPPFTIRVNQLRVAPDDAILQLMMEGVALRQAALLPEAFVIESLPVGLEELPSFQSGKISVQDESAMLAAHLLQPKPGETIIDLCAAPGGKSAHIAEIVREQAKIFSVDIYAHKIRLITENAARLGLSNIIPCLGDARIFQLPDNQLADAVLLDAPCSGTGVLRRRVDARYRRQPEDIKELAALQRSILTHAAELVRPGGRLIYVTCSLEKEENQDQITAFCAAHPDFQIINWRGFLPVQLAEYLVEPELGWATILPSAGSGDGFFLCRLERKLS